MLEHHSSIFSSDFRYARALGEVFRSIGEVDALHALWRKRAKDTTTQLTMVLLHLNKPEAACEMLLEGVYRLMLAPETGV